MLDGLDIVVVVGVLEQWGTALMKKRREGDGYMGVGIGGDDGGQPTDGTSL
jgi:hypothetical protein